MKGLIYLFLLVLGIKAPATASIIEIQGSFNASQFTPVLPITDSNAMPPINALSGSYSLSFDTEAIDNQYGNVHQILALIDLDFLSLEIDGVQYETQDGHAWLWWSTTANGLFNVTVAGIENSFGQPSLGPKRGTNDFMFISSLEEFKFTTVSSTEMWDAGLVNSSLSVTEIPLPAAFLNFLLACVYTGFFKIYSQAKHHTRNKQRLRIAMFPQL